MIDLADLRFIQAIRSAASLAAVARALNVTPPAVSQRLSQLEAGLRLKLVDRAAGLSLTAEGELMALHADAILEQMSELETGLAERRGVVAGPLHIVAPLGFGRLYIAPQIDVFMSRYPEVVPMLTLADDPLGVARSGAWDVIIAIGGWRQMDLIQRKLASNRRFLCAAPQYLKEWGSPKGLEDLKSHRCGVVRENEADVTLWSLTHRRGGKKSVRVHPRFASNDGEVVRSWAIQGHGIIERSEWSVSDDLQSGRLVQVLPDWSLPKADVVALLNPQSQRARRADAFVQLLADSFASGIWTLGENSARR